MAGLLQCDGKAGVRQRILRCQRCQGKRSGDGGLKLFRITQRADEPVMRLHVRRVCSDRLAKRLSGAASIPCGKQIDAKLRMLV